MRLTDPCLGGSSALWVSGPCGFGEDGTGCRLMNTLPGVSVHVRAHLPVPTVTSNIHLGHGSRFIHWNARQRRGGEDVKKRKAPPHSSAASADGRI